MKRLVRGAAVTAAAGALGFLLIVSNIGAVPTAADSGTATTTACPAPQQGQQANFSPPAHANGTIAAINGATFTVTQQDNTTVTVTTDTNTHYGKTVASSVGAIATGDFVMAQGTTPSTGTFTATAITDNGQQQQGGPGPGGNGPGRQGGPGGPGGNGPGGNGGNGQPPAAPNGTPPAGANGAPPTLPAGCAPPQGRQGQQGQQQPPGNGANSGTMVAGVVKQVSGTTLTLTTRDNATVTVTTDGNTTVTAHQQGAFTDLHVGDQVDARANPSNGTSNTATAFTAGSVNDRTAH